MCYFAAMSGEIGIRELRQEASVHLRAVADGAEFTITDRGRPVARLIPISPLEGHLSQQISDHGLRAPARPRRSFASIQRLGGPGLSELVEADREERRVLGA